MPSPVHHRKSIIATKHRPTKLMILPIFIMVFCFCALCAYILYDARRATMERATEVATSLAAAVEADISRTVESVDLSLQAVVDNLKLPNIEQMDPELRRMLLFDRSTQARNIGKLVVTDETGRVRLDSQDPDPKPVDLSDRDYFQVHKNSATVGTYIGRPVASRLSGEWIVAVSRRLSHADGSFAGIASASLRLDYFEDLFKKISAGAGGIITLARTDGIVLMRWPFKVEYIDRDLSDSRLLNEYAHSRSGHYEQYSVIDGEHRLLVYSQIGNTPLVIAVGQSTAQIYAQWNSYAFGVIFVIALLCAMAVLLSMYLAYELERRKRAENQLAVLAATDVLTSLSNRRHFNETLGREWRRAGRDQLPLALVMIDVDNFKPYNDVHGHQAGDLMLKTIGAAIAGSLNRGGDIGSRYGGDEFAVLLAGTTPDGARRVADKIRLNFATFCQREHMTHLGLSIGIASMTPKKGLRSADLVELADQALYSAKNRGRNRTEVALKSAAEPAPDAVSKSTQAA
jgi:diguanylate cyclase (GGDEF)-like protein